MLVKCLNKNCGWTGREEEGMEKAILGSDNLFLCPMCAKPLLEDHEANQRQAEKEKQNLYPTYKYLTYDHLTDAQLKNTSQTIALAAEMLLKGVPDGPEKAEGFRKLLEAKDCFVRACLGDK